MTALPYNEEAEQGLLGGILIDNRSLDRVIEYLKPEHFYAEVHQRIFSALITIIGRGENCSAVTLRKYFETEKSVDHIIGGEYIARIAASVVTVVNIPEYGKQILDLYRRRETILTLEEAVSRAAKLDPDDTASTIIGDVETSLYKIAEGGAQESRDEAFSSAIVQAVANAQAAYHGDPGARGLTTGIKLLNERMGGLKKSDLVIIAGRPSQGKTALATGLAWAAADSGHSVAFFSLEMSSAQLATRIISAESGVPADLVHKGRVNAEQFRRFVTASQNLANLPLYIDDRPGRTIAQIRAAARRLKRRHGIGLIVVDYLQLIAAAGKSGNNRVNDVTEITAGLKGLAKEMDVPVVALSQLSRAVEQREDKRPQLSDLRESGSIEQDADIVGFVYREEYYLEREEPSRRGNETDATFQDRYLQWEGHRAEVKGKAEIIIGKNRHGPVCVVPVAFDGPTTTFSDAPLDHQTARAA